MSRLDDKRTGAIVIVMQRVHLDDLTGYVLSLSDDWTVLNLPAIAEIDEDVALSLTEVYRRRAGEALSPEREPLWVLEDLRRQLGSDAFSAQYQQEPVPPGGAMVKRAWIKRYHNLPPREERPYVVQSWDTASKGGPENDFSVCTTWQVTHPSVNPVTVLPSTNTLPSEVLTWRSAPVEWHTTANVLPAARKDSNSLIEFLSSARSHIGPWPPG